MLFDGNYHNHNKLLYVLVNMFANSLHHSVAVVMFLFPHEPHLMFAWVL